VVQKPTHSEMFATGAIMSTRGPLG